MESLKNRFAAGKREYPGSRFRTRRPLPYEHWQSVTRLEDRTSAFQIVRSSRLGAAARPQDANSEDHDRNRLGTPQWPRVHVDQIISLTWQRVVVCAESVAQFAI
jgi:hypothetical protein